MMPHAIWTHHDPPIPRVQVFSAACFPEAAELQGENFPLLTSLPPKVTGVYL